MIQIFNKNILIVDDDELHIEIFKSKLKGLGYNQLSSVTSYAEAGTYLSSYSPDLIILDYYLDKNHTGVDLVKEHLLNSNIPIIFISTFYGSEVFKEILGVTPIDFLPKNISGFDLDKSITLSFSKQNELLNSCKLKEFIFVRSSKEIKKVELKQIEFITVDEKYLELLVNSKKYIIRSTLNDFYKKLPDYFIKVHKAFVINLGFLDSINLEDNTIKVGIHQIPFSRNHKKDLFAVYYLP